MCIVDAKKHVHVTGGQSQETLFEVLSNQTTFKYDR